MLIIPQARIQMWCRKSVNESLLKLINHIKIVDMFEDLKKILLNKCWKIYDLANFYSNIDEDIINVVRHKIKVALL